MTIIRSLNVRKQVTAYLMILPAVIFLGFFMFYAAFEATRLSFYSWYGIGEKTFVGLANFRELFNDPRFYNSLYKTGLLAGGRVVGLIGMGFLLALALHKRVTGWKVFRVIFYLNCVISLTVVGLLWGSLLNPVVGPITILLKMVHLVPPGWLGDPNVVIWTLIGIGVWQFSGFPMIFLYASMEGIPTQVYEAAALDGITPLKEVWYITLPLIKPVLLTITLLQIIFSLAVFDIVFVMTKGGPGYSTEVLTLYMYRVAFRFHRFGYGSCIAVVFVLGTLAIAYLFIRATRLKEA